MTRVPHCVAVALVDVVIGHDRDGLTIGLGDLTGFFFPQPKVVKTPDFITVAPSHHMPLNAPEKQAL